MKTAYYLLFAGLLLAENATRAQGHIKCTIDPPPGWEAAGTQWDGDCHAGIADGLGVLKEYNGKNVKRLFFGQVKNGAPQLGVIDQDGGYKAGRFEHGKILNNEDRQTIISAFELATTAADEAAQRFNKAGNTGSSQFYKTKANMLRKQMD